MATIDSFVQNYFVNIRTPFLTDFMRFISKFFDLSWYFLCIILAAFLLLYIFKNRREAFLLLSTVLFTGGFVYALKSTFAVSRPLNGVISVSSSSFPSHHATIATVFFILLMYLFREGKKTTEILFRFFCVAAIILIALSRLYLGVHWLSDVVGGVSLGIIIVSVSIYLFNSPYFGNKSESLPSSMV